MFKEKLFTPLCPAEYNHGLLVAEPTLVAMFWTPTLLLEHVTKINILLKRNASFIKSVDKTGTSDVILRHECKI